MTVEVMSKCPSLQFQNHWETPATKSEFDTVIKIADREGKHKNMPTCGQAAIETIVSTNQQKWKWVWKLRI